MYMKILGATPDRLTLTQKDWDGMTENLNTHRRNDDWWYFANQVIHMKLLGATAEQLSLTPKDWGGMTEKLNTFRRDNEWGKFASQAMAMTILSAKEVRITDKGIELIKAEPKAEFNSDRTKLPERRKF
jgi:hypothetical protein